MNTLAQEGVGLSKDTQDVILEWPIIKCHLIKHMYGETHLVVEVLHEIPRFQVGQQYSTLSKIRLNVKGMANLWNLEGA